LETWIKGLETFLNFERCPDKDRKDQLLFWLKGAAKDWVDMVFKDKIHKVTFNDICQELQSLHVSNYAKVTMKSDMLAFKQDKAELHAYAIAKARLWNNVETNPSESDQTDWFLSGLDQEFKDKAFKLAAKRKDGDKPFQWFLRELIRWNNDQKAIGARPQKQPVNEIRIEPPVVTEPPRAKLLPQLRRDCQGLNVQLVEKTIKIRTVGIRTKDWLLVTNVVNMVIGLESVETIKHQDFTVTTTSTVIIKTTTEV